MKLIKNIISLIIKTIKLILKIVFTCFNTFILFTLAVTVFMYTTTSCTSSKEYEGTPEAIVILGCSVLADGNPSPMLQDRLDAGYKVYKKTKATILVSGDKEEYYDEVGCMKDYLISLGVPAKKIIEDGDGYTTYQSIYNCANTYGYQNIVVVSQKYHLPRALYLCARFNIKAVGVYAKEVEYDGQDYRFIREYLSRDKAFFDGFLKPDVSFHLDVNNN